MVNGRPKTPLFRVDGERGLVFCGPEKRIVKDVGFSAGISQGSQQRSGDLTALFKGLKKCVSIPRKCVV